MKVASARRLCFAAQVCFHFSFKDVLRSDSRRYFECVFHNIVTFSYFRFKLDRRGKLSACVQDMIGYSDVKYRCSCRHGNHKLSSKRLKRDTSVTTLTCMYGKRFLFFCKTNKSYLYGCLYYGDASAIPGYSGEGLL